jgi:UPF0755 protein
MRRALKLLLLLVVFVVIGGGIAASMMWTRIHEPFKAYAEEEQFVQIPQGASTRDIGKRLIEAGVVRDELQFRVATWWSGRARKLQAGEYRFDRPLSPIDVVDMIARGEVFARRLTFPEGLTIREMAKIWESQGFGPAAQFVQAAKQRELITDLDPDAKDLEGYLFPDTYPLPRGTAAPKLIAMMVERFRATCTPEMRAQASAQGLTIRQLVTLASLVEKETGAGAERSLVAAVYRNRLKIGMGMQADPTVIYALEQAGRYDGNIRRDDLTFDSPYNTYKYAGLPPGPISAPGRASLEAAAAPADVPYLYFVSRNDGSHVFATTLAEHNRNVQRFQVEFFREQKRASGDRRQKTGGRS